MTSRSDIASLLKLGETPVLLISWSTNPSKCLQQRCVSHLINIFILSDDYIDLVIPRGSGELVKYIKVHSIPCPQY